MTVGHVTDDLQTTYYILKGCNLIARKGNIMKEITVTTTNNALVNYLNSKGINYVSPKTPTIKAVNTITNKTDFYTAINKNVFDIVRNKLDENNIVYTTGHRKNGDFIYIKATEHNERVSEIWFAYNKYCLYTRKKANIEHLTDKDKYIYHNGYNLEHEIRFDNLNDLIAVLVEFIDSLKKTA